MNKIQNFYVVLNVPALDFILHKIKERELQKIIYPISILI